MMKKIDKFAAVKRLTADDRHRHGNVTRFCELVGVSRVTFYNWNRWVGPAYVERVQALLEDQ